MRTIEISRSFKKDYKRAKADPRHIQDVRGLFEATVLLLAEDKLLPERYRDHALSGEWKGYRECHLKSDLLLIYNIEKSKTLRIVRLGSHSELFNK